MSGTGASQNKYKIMRHIIPENLLLGVWTYIKAPMVYEYYTDAKSRGRKSDKPSAAWRIHLLKAIISEGIIRIVLSLVYTLIMAQVHAGTVSFLMGALVKAGIFVSMFASLGYHTAFGRAENLWTAWFPSSTRAMAPNHHTIPYADLLHTIALTISQYVFSLVGVALALWLTDFKTVNTGLPNSIFAAGGVIGAHTINLGSLWLAEILGSAVITFIFLLTTVDFHGMSNRGESGITQFFGIAAVVGVLMPASGANFDSLHFLAMKTVLSASKHNQGHGNAAYIVGPWIGAAIAWILWNLIVLLDWHIIGVNPGVPTTVKSEEQEINLESNQRPVTTDSNIMSRRIAHHQYGNNSPWNRSMAVNRRH